MKTQTAEPRVSLILTAVIIEEFEIKFLSGDERIFCSCSFTKQ